MQLEFYKIIAQIIPILFLGITIQSIFVIKGEKYDKNESFQRNIHIMVFITAVLILALGEFAALRCVYQNITNINSLIVVGLSMSFAYTWITAEYILTLIGKTKQMWYMGFMLLGILLNIIIFIKL